LTGALAVAYGRPTTRKRGDEMATDAAPPPGWEIIDDEFFFFRLEPNGKGGSDPRFDPPYSTFQITVDSQSDSGRLWHQDPLAVLLRADEVLRERGQEPAFRVPPDREDTQVLSFRVNAQLPANPRLHSATVNRYPGSTIFVIVHFKDLGERG